MAAPTEPIVIEGEWHIPYLYSAGTVPSRFLIELRDNARVMGTRCGNCKRVLVPARAFCADCFSKLDDWVEVGPGGVVETFTVCRESYQGLPEPPFVTALVKLDGADTGIVNFLTGVDPNRPEAITPGMKVRAVFAEQRGPAMSAFHFEPA